MASLVLAHLSDLHLGFRAYSRVTEKGTNARETDVILAFAEAADEIRADPEIKLVVISGDLFHSAQPTPAVWYSAARILNSLAENCHVVICGGNHDHPKSAQDGHPMLAFKELKNADHIHVVIGSPQVVNLGNVVVLCLPHGSQRQADQVVERADMVGEMSGNGKVRVLVVHAAIRTPDGRVLYAEMSRNSLPLEAMSPDRWDYIAAGDYHVATELSENAWYAGSLEYTASGPWEEAKDGVAKGWLRVTVPGRGKKVEIERVLSTTRPVIDLPVVHAREMSAVDLNEMILSQFTEAEVETGDEKLSEHMVRQLVIGVRPEVRSALDWGMIRSLQSKAFHFHLHTKAEKDETDTEDPTMPRSRFEGVTSELKSFVEEQGWKPPGGVDLALVQKKADRYLSSTTRGGGEEEDDHGEGET